MSRLLSIILHKKVHATAMVRSLHTSQNTQDIPLRFHWSYTVSPRFATFDNYVFLTLGQGLSSEKMWKIYEFTVSSFGRPTLTAPTTAPWKPNSEPTIVNNNKSMRVTVMEINMADGSQLAIVKESYAFLKVGLGFPSFDMSCRLISWDL